MAAREVRFAWLLIGGLIAAWLVGFAVAQAFTRTFADQLRYTSLLLEGFGLCIVARGLSDLRREFQRPTAWQTVRQWAAQIPGMLGPQSTTLEAHSTGHFHITGSPSIIAHGHKVNPTLEDRVHRLERDVVELRDRAESTMAAIDAERAQREQSLAEEKAARAAADAGLSKRLEMTMVGGLHLEIVGLTWLVVGLTLSGLSSEIHALWRWIS